MVSTILPPIQPSYQSKKTATVTERPSSPLLASPFKRKTMSITQTYYLAHKARAKLSAEAQKPDHDLRRLVGSANLLDALMMELADAEREQESWFNQSVRGATKKSEDRRVQWADTVVQEPEEDWDAEDADSDSASDSGSEYDEDQDEDVEMADTVSLTRIASADNSHKTVSTTTSVARISTVEEDEYFDDDDEEDYAQLSLTRSPSHSTSSPPDLDHDWDSSEDESMPPSPPTATLPGFSEKEQQEPTASEKAFYEQGFYVPSRNPARLVSAISVY